MRYPRPPSYRPPAHKNPSNAWDATTLVKGVLWSAAHFVSVGHCGHAYHRPDRCTGCPRGCDSLWTPDKRKSQPQRGRAASPQPLACRALAGTDAACTPRVRGVCRRVALGCSRRWARIKRSNWSCRCAGIWVLACSENPLTLAQRRPVSAGCSPKSQRCIVYGIVLERAAAPLPPGQQHCRSALPFALQLCNFGFQYRHPFFQSDRCHRLFPLYTAICSATMVP